jgi:hypothetical protein
MGHITVKYLADGTEANVTQVGHEPREETQSMAHVLIDTMVG